MRLRNALALLIALVCLPACATLTTVFETEPPKPSQSEVVRLLCTRADDGSFIFGPIYVSRADVLSDETVRRLSAHAAAWDEATNKGELCGSLGAVPFGGMKWGSPDVEHVAPVGP